MDTHVCKNYSVTNSAGSPSAEEVAWLTQGEQTKLI